MEVRLQKYLADCGIASRRKSEELILSGKVSVNGKVITELGVKVNSEKDEIKFNGRIFKNNKTSFVYVLLNKPIGYVSTVVDQFERDTVLDIINIPGRRLVPVGRLDMYTSGALILTDDGDFVYKVTHPKREIDKTYTVTVIGIVTDEEVQKLRDGVIIDEEYKTKPAKVKILKTDVEKNQSRLEITIHEGKNRQVRKMCETVGRKVIALHRSKIGNVKVNDMKIGTWRYLKPNEVDSILNYK